MSQLPTGLEDASADSGKQRNCELRLADSSLEAHDAASDDEHLTVRSLVAVEEQRVFLCNAVKVSELLGLIRHHDVAGLLCLPP